jgi:hypothetical protein
MLRSVCLSFPFGRNLFANLELEDKLEADYQQYPGLPRERLRIVAAGKKMYSSSNPINSPYTSCENKLTSLADPIRTQAAPQ